METLLVCYFTAIGLLVIYGLHRSYLVGQVLYHPFRTSLPAQSQHLPSVCVQIPLYNEVHVAARIINAIGSLTYPEDLIEIQILDDSNDGTGAIVDACVAELRTRGRKVSILRRSERTEFKAGALRAGMSKSSAEVFAIFDADFVPDADFLLLTVPYFADQRVGFVQSRWGHLNRTQNILTRAQAVLLDGHFMIEHVARSRIGCLNFNGTAGLWRRKAISDAGGWQGDTLTEDLDLSYRALLAGWRPVYLRDVVCQAELPSTIAAFKTQQFRWTKGAIQTFRKLMLRIAKSGWPLGVKREAFFHLSAPSCYILMLVVMVLLLPVSVLRSDGQAFVGSWFEGVVFGVTVVSLGSFYVTSQILQRGRLSFIDIVAAVLLGIGICAHCAGAALSGLVRAGGNFVRTPKSGADDRGAQFVVSENCRSRLSQVAVHRIEIGLACYLAYCSAFFLLTGNVSTIPFALLLFAGVGLVLGSALPDRSTSPSSEILLAIDEIEA